MNRQIDDLMTFSLINGQIYRQNYNIYNLDEQRSDHPIKFIGQMEQFKHRGWEISKYPIFLKIPSPPPFDLTEMDMCPVASDSGFKCKLKVYLCPWCLILT